MLHKKFPRIKNLPFSRSDSSDDVWWSSTISLFNEEVVILEKLDGENTTLCHDKCYARSVDSANSHHPSRSYVKQLHGGIKHLLDDDKRFCGESVYAKHSIYYDQLPSYYFLFGVFDSEDMYLAWDDVEVYSNILEIPTPPILYRGIYTSELEDKLKTYWPFASLLGAPEAEGFVVRLARDIYPDEWNKSIAKYVRPKHVTTDQHWFNNWTPNLLMNRE